MAATIQVSFNNNNFSVAVDNSPHPYKCDSHYDNSLTSLECYFLQVRGPGTGIPASTDLACIDVWALDKGSQKENHS